jgi:hypothetical protein
MAKYLLPFVAVNFECLRHELGHVTNIDGGNAGEKSGQKSCIALTRTNPGTNRYELDR